MKKSYFNKNISVYFLLLLVPLFWGGAFVVTKHLVAELPPFTAATLRFAPSGIILLIILFLRSEWDFEAVQKHWFSLIIMSITGIFLYNSLSYIALNYTSSINGSLIMASTPVLLTISSVFFLNESWNKYMIFGLIISFIGIVIVITKGSIFLLLSFSFNKGDILFIGALISWVIHGLVGKIVLQKVSPMLTTTITMIIGSILLGVCSIFEKGWGNILSLSIQSWFELIYLVIFATILAFLLWNKGVKQIGSSKSSIYMNLVPINAAWVSVSFYGGEITFIQVLGIIIVILGVYFSTLNNKLEVKKRKLNTDFFSIRYINDKLK